MSVGFPGGRRRKTVGRMSTVHPGAKRVCGRCKHTSGRRGIWSRRGTFRSRCRARAWKLRRAGSARYSRRVYSLYPMRPPSVKGRRIEVVTRDPPSSNRRRGIFIFSRKTSFSRNLHPGRMPPCGRHLPGSRYFFRRTCRRKKCDLIFYRSRKAFAFHLPI